MIISNETVCKCDICGKEMRESETGHKRWPCYLVLGSNMHESFTRRYEDVCGDCARIIRATINRIQGNTTLDDN